MNPNKLHRNPSLRSSFVRDTSYRMSPVFGYVPSCLIWLALFLLTGSVAFGSTTPTFIQERDNQVNSGKTSGVTLASPTTAGNLIVAYLIWDNTGSASVSDSLGNSYASAVAPTRWSNGKYSAQVFYTINLRGGVDTVTATFATAVSSFGIVYAHEYSGISQTAPVDVTAAAAAASGSLNSGPATTTNATDLLFAGGVTANVVTSPGAGYMARATSHGNMTEDRIASSKGSYSATASNGGGAWAMQMVAFKGVSSGTSSSATLQSVAVSPSNSSVSQSQTQQFTATGTYSDASTKNITTSGTWASSNTAVATIGANTASRPASPGHLADHGSPRHRHQSRPQSHRRHVGDFAADHRFTFQFVGHSITNPAARGHGHLQRRQHQEHHHQCNLGFLQHRRRYHRREHGPRNRHRRGYLADHGYPRKCCHPRRHRHRRQGVSLQSIAVSPPIRR